MKRFMNFGVIFFTTNLLFFILLIEKQSRYTHALYLCQKEYTRKETLFQKKQSLTNQLYAMQSPALLKKRAIEELNFTNISINSIKKVRLS